MKNWLPITSNNSKSKFNKKNLNLSNHTRRFCIPCPMNASLLGLRHSKGTERDNRWLHNSIKYAHLQFFPEVTPQSSFTFMIIFCCRTMILLTRFICINDSAASTSNLKTCSCSKLCTLGEEALVPKFLDVDHTCVKTFCETPFLIRCDCFFVWKVRNIYMNSMNVRIHLLIEFTCL